MYEQVKEFHKATGLVVNESPITINPDASLENETRRLCELRINLIEEEARELIDAIKQGDIVEIADGICDLHYVVSGTAVSFGIPEDRCFAEVQRSNMSKIEGGVIRREDGKILKGPNFSPPDLKKAIYG